MRTCDRAAIIVLLLAILVGAGGGCMKVASIFWDRDPVPRAHVSSAPIAKEIVP